MCPLTRATHFGHLFLTHSHFTAPRLDSRIIGFRSFGFFAGAKSAGSETWNDSHKPNWWVPKIGESLGSSLPEFMDFTLFGKTILVVNKKFGLFWRINSGSEAHTSKIGKN